MDLRILRARAASFACALACLALLMVGASLAPASAGHGTHEQIGLSACPFPRAFGLPCATCGMTTAVSLAAHGRIGAAFWTQPGGALLALIAAGLFWSFLWAGLTGAGPHRLWPRRWTCPAIWIGLGVVLGAWGFKALTWPG